MIQKRKVSPMLFSVVILQGQSGAIKYQNILLLVAIVVILILLVLVITYAINKRKTDTLIKEKELMLQVKSRKLEESISYAERLQTAILPSPDKTEEILKEHFIFFKPQQTVGGDLYWVEQRGSKKMFAVVDCTGHGVAGTLMSIIAYDGLNRAIIDYELTRADKIVSALKEYFTDTLRQTGSIDVKDSIDIALCVLNTEKKQLEYAGARDSLYLVRQSGNTLISNDEELEPVAQLGPVKLYEILPDRKSIEPVDRAMSFTNNRIEIETGDSIYLFSDGYADQFGGKESKKFGYQHLRETLLSIQNLTMWEQDKKLEEILRDWKKGQDQVDDITILGLKI